MTAQIINLADYRKAKEAEQVRKVVNDYFAAHSQIMAWWLSGTGMSRVLLKLAKRSLPSMILRDFEL